MTTPHKHADVIKAWADGATIQFLFKRLDDSTAHWIDCADNFPAWEHTIEYRVKPAPLPVTRERVLNELKHLQESDDPESAHSQADDLLCDLLESLGYEDVVEAWHAIGKWYS